MVVIAIIAILSAAVVGNYGSFRSAAVATNMAYEVALTLRQSQIYGLGVRLPNQDAASLDTYGVEFSADSPSYAIFHEASVVDGLCDGGGGACNCADAGGECVEQVSMLQQIKVEALCASTDASLSSTDLLGGQDGGGNSLCAHEELSVTFTRPYPEGTIRAGGQDDWNIAGILIRGGGHCRLVRAYANGQISVEGISAADAEGTQFEDDCLGV